MKESFRKPPDILSKYIFSAQLLARPKKYSIVIMYFMMCIYK